MPLWNELDRDSLQRLVAGAREDYEAIKAKKLALDMTRGKPSSAQLDLAAGMLALPGTAQLAKSRDGVDCRNYGGLDGLQEAKDIFAPMLDCRPQQMLIGGNASLALMHDAVIRGLIYGYLGGTGPWLQQGPVKFICPVPGYDRHFGLLQHLGIGMVPVPLTAAGPDMELVARLCQDDPSIKGIFCVPKYSNPTGCTYSAEVVKALGAMKAAPDFRIFWDNAYAVHHLGGGAASLTSILTACAAAGHPNRPLVFGSTSKISFAGGGISFLASSDAGLAEALGHMQFQTIGPDKLNILRHAQFFKSFAGLEKHMAAHAAILAPKFAAVTAGLRETLGGTGLLHWTEPQGGYFVSIDTLPGTAQRTVALAAEVGVKLTAAGATFPLGRDPQDSNIRIAPSLPPLADVVTATAVVAACVKIAGGEKLLQG